MVQILLARILTWNSMETQPQFVCRWAACNSRQFGGSSWRGLRVTPKETLEAIVDLDSCLPLIEPYLLYSTPFYTGFLLW